MCPAHLLCVLLAESYRAFLSPKHFFISHKNKRMKHLLLTALFVLSGSFLSIGQTISTDDIQSEIMQAKERDLAARISIISETMAVTRTHLSSQERNRLDPVLRGIVADYRGNTQHLRQITQSRDLEFVGFNRDNEAVYGVVIYTRDGIALQQEYQQIFKPMERFATARVTASELSRLASDERVRFIEIGELNFPEMDISLFETGAQYLQNGSINNTIYDGQGAIVLIFDTGIDWRHPDFKNPYNPEETRIRYLWDVTLNANASESTPGNGLDYGVEYSQEDINAALRGEGTVRSLDVNGHGTHVAGSATASGERFRGIAPGAEFIVIRGGVSGFSLNNIMNGLHYAKMKSEELNMPIVVNFSLGGHGPKDGSRPDEQLIDFYSSEPGFVVVNSAGNSGGNLMHSEHIIPPGGSSTITLRVPNYTPAGGAANDFLQMDAWTANGNHPVDVIVSSPAMITEAIMRNPEDLSVAKDTLIQSTDGSFYISSVTDENNGDRRLFFQIWDQQAANTPAVGDWTITLENPGDEEIRINAFLYNLSQSMASTFKVGGDNRMTLTPPATASKGITVANYVSKINWINTEGSSFAFTNLEGTGGIAGSSSRGPTRYFEEKPDIAAPGFLIMASYSANSNRQVPFIAYGDQHVGLTGTSMAAPHVAGAAAVLLGINPNLTADEIRELLREAAHQDSFTGNEWNSTWGTGKLNVLDAAIALLEADLPYEREQIQHHGRMLALNQSNLQITGFQQVAFAFSPSMDGAISHALVHTNEVVAGEGNVIISLRSAVNGRPGGRLGNDVVIPISRVLDGYMNHFDVSANGAQLTADEEYFITIRLDNPTDVLSILTDNGVNGTENSMFFNGTNWSTVATATGSAREMVMVLEISDGFIDAEPAEASSSVQFVNISNTMIDVYWNGAPVSSTLQLASSYLDIPSGEEVEIRIENASDESTLLTETIAVDANSRIQIIFTGEDVIIVPMDDFGTIPAGNVNLAVLNQTSLSEISFDIAGEDETFGPFSASVLSDIFTTTAENKVVTILNGPAGELLEFAPTFTAFRDQYATVIVQEDRMILAGSSGLVMERMPYEAGTALVQIIHNANDTRRETVSISLNGEVVLENLAFQSATGYLELPANIGIGLGIHNTPLSGAFFDVEVELEADKRYVVVALGIETNNHADNPDGISNDFELLLLEKSSITAGNASEVDFHFVHGGTDAPGVRLEERNSSSDFGFFRYSDVSTTLSVAAATTVFDLYTSSGDRAGSFVFEMDELAGEAGMLLVNGFVNPAQNRNGAPLGMMFVASDGEVVLPRNITSVEDPADTGLPQTFALQQNYPNPFNPTTTIQYQLPEASTVQITVYDMLGRRVALLMNNEQAAGIHSISFDASALASGMYLYRLQAGEFVQTRKMMLIK